MAEREAGGQAVTLLGVKPGLPAQGTVVSCAGAHLSLWNVNGQPLASITTAWGPEGAITCCCIAEGPAWDASHAIITGSRDGMVRVGVSGWDEGTVQECVHLYSAPFLQGSEPAGYMRPF